MSSIKHNNSFIKTILSNKFIFFFFDKIKKILVTKKIIMLLSNGYKMYLRRKYIRKNKKDKVSKLKNSNKFLFFVKQKLSNGVPINRWKKKVQNYYNSYFFFTLFRFTAQHINKRKLFFRLPSYNTFFFNNQKYLFYFLNRNKNIFYAPKKYFYWYIQLIYVFSFLNTLKENTSMYAFKSTLQNKHAYIFLYFFYSTKSIINNVFLYYKNININWYLFNIYTDRRAHV